MLSAWPGMAHLSDVLTAGVERGRGGGPGHRHRDRHRGARGHGRAGAAAESQEGARKGKPERNKMLELLKGITKQLCGAVRHNAGQHNCYTELCHTGFGELFVATWLTDLALKDSL